MNTLKLILRSLNVIALLTLELYPITLTPPPSPREWFQAADNNQKLSSFPYITGDTLRTLASCCIDELRIPFNTNDIHDGDIIFVRSNLIPYFFDVVHPLLQAHYILISHNEDSPAIRNYENFLDDEKLIAWFAMNVEITHRHPKLHLIPIGIANSYWPFGNVEILDEVTKKLPNIQKQHLLYINFYLEDTRASRIPIYKLFLNKPWAYRRYGRPWNEYLEDLVSSLFVLSPHGNGLDCYRTWEALLMGSIPVVKTSSLDPLYDDLPVVIVQEWEEVTEEFLVQKYREISTRDFKMQKIYAQHWLYLIKECQKNFLHATR
ncbi:MAG: hypothetical protein NTX86_02760 [Candidatus Dependentiae bacterium]|nr:hypothetical protein [Candidatus Dependentiae bacterium]